MKDTSRLELKINEFQKFIGIEVYNPVLDRVLRQLDATPLRSTALYPGLNESKLQHHRPTTSPGTDVFDICIRTNEPKGKREVLLFDLLHEWGHFLDEERLTLDNQHDPVLRLGRELRAWEFADEEFDRHSELTANRSAYESY